MDCLAFSNIDRMTKKNRAAVSLGRRGGKARAKNLTAEQLSAIARKANAVRWKGHVKLRKK
jgi:hypothetical protein